MKIKSTKTYHTLELKPEQYRQISSEEKIHTALAQHGCKGFDAYEQDVRVGFALVREYAPGCFFLWDFIIDQNHQNQGKGHAFLKLLLEHLKEAEGAKTVTTTYVAGNEAARKLYGSMGFRQTDIYRDDDIHEVNMKLELEEKL